MFECNFMRRLDVKKSSDKLSTTFPTGGDYPYYMMLARGRLVMNSWHTTYHDERTTSIDKILFTPDEKHKIYESGKTHP